MSQSLRPLPSDLPTGVHCAPLAGLRLIQASGADTLAFLHSQFTQDVQNLVPGQARLGAYCSAKGRMQASFVYWRHETSDGLPCIRAIVDASLAESFLKRLRMFVLRAKVTLEIMEAGIQGLWAEDAAAAGAVATALGELPTAPWTVSAGPDAVYIAAPVTGAGVAARWWRVDASQTAPGACAASPDTWRAQDIAAGLPWISAELHEVLTPQMANFDLIDGVSFTKGCYPGQEVVARSHYLGRVKRRTLLGRIETGAVPAGELKVGTDIYNGATVDAGPIGRVVNHAQTEAGDTLLLFEAALDAAATDLRYGASDGPRVSPQALPYSLSPDTP